MARRALMLIPVVLALMGNRGCQTAGDRVEEAYAAKARAEAQAGLPSLPADCSAHIGPVPRRAGDLASHVIKRWEVLAANRDRQADNCAAWWGDYKMRIEGQGGK